MNITVLELEQDKAKIVIIGQGHTFMNALITELIKDPVIDVANYIIEFQFSDPVLTVTTHEKKDPIPPIMDACKRISKNCSELLDDLKKISKR